MINLKGIYLNFIIHKARLEKKKNEPIPKGLAYLKKTMSHAVQGHPRQTGHG